jgi:hypothetical protein
MEAQVSQEWHYFCRKIFIVLVLPVPIILLVVFGLGEPLLQLFQRFLTVRNFRSRGRAGHRQDCLRNYYQMRTTCCCSISGFNQNAGGAHES